MKYLDKTITEIHELLKSKKIKLPKLGLIDIRGYRNLEIINGNIINATIVKETTNKYYVNVLYNVIFNFPNSP